MVPDLIKSSRRAEGKEFLLAIWLIFVKSVVRIRGEENDCRKVYVVKRIHHDATTVQTSSVVRFREEGGKNEQNDKTQV